jgi:hypothetical protein
MPASTEDITEVEIDPSAASDDSTVAVDESTMDFLDSVIKGQTTVDPIDKPEEVDFEAAGETDEDTVKSFVPEQQVQPAVEEPESNAEESATPEPGSEIQPTDDTRNRDVLRNVTDPLLMETIRIKQGNQNLSMAEAESLAKKVLGIEDEAKVNEDGTIAYEDLSTAEKLEYDNEELKEVSQQLIEKHRIGIIDEEFEALSNKKDELIRTIAKNETKLETEKVEASKRIASLEETEAELAKEFTDLTDEDSLLFIAVSATSSKLMDQYRKGTAPDWFKPGDPTSMRRIAQEQHERINGVAKAPVAQPGAAKTASSAHQAKGPVPAKVVNSPAQTRSIPGTPVQTKPVIRRNVSDSDFLSDLNAVIRGTATVTPQRSNGRYEIVD